MSYLLDKKTQQKKVFKIALGVILFFILFYFRAGVWSGFSTLSHTVFRPVLIGGNNIGEKFTNLQGYFISKNSLYLENQKLQSQIVESEADRANYTAVVAENESLKEILGRKPEQIVMTLATILAKPNQSPYDTLIIDVGIKQDIKIGDLVFALGYVPLGRIAEVYANSAKVILFSSAGEKTTATIAEKNIAMELVGRGGGNFEMNIPRDLTLAQGNEVVLPGINPAILAVVEAIISDPRDPFTKALLRSPINVQAIKFVQVVK
jgi:cell shape-determining protein MreC